MPLEYLWAWSPCQDAVGVPEALRWQTAAGGIGNPKRALNQDAVGDPAALRWQTAAGGIGNPKRALDQDAVGVPAALRWQTAAGGIGNPTGHWARTRLEYRRR